MLLCLAMPALATEAIPPRKYTPADFQHTLLDIPWALPIEEGLAAAEQQLGSAFVPTDNPPLAPNGAGQAYQATDVEGLLLFGIPVHSLFCYTGLHTDEPQLDFVLAELAPPDDDEALGAFFQHLVDAYGIPTGYNGYRIDDRQGMAIYSPPRLPNSHPDFPAIQQDTGSTLRLSIAFGNLILWYIQPAAGDGASQAEYRLYFHGEYYKPAMVELAIRMLEGRDSP